MQIGFQSPWWSFVDSMVGAAPYVQLVHADPKGVIDYINALATSVVAIFTVIAVVVAVLEYHRAEREKRRDAERLRAELEARRRATDVHIATEAYTLRRQIVLWLDQVTVLKPMTAIDWWQTHLEKQVGDAEARLAAMMNQTPAATPEVSAVVGKIFFEFYHAMDMIDFVVTYRALDDARENIALYIGEPWKALNSCMLGLAELIMKGMDPVALKELDRLEATRRLLAEKET